MPARKRSEEREAASEAGALLGHLPFLTTILIVGYGVVKAYRVSGVDTGTALTLLRTSGLASIATGALLTVLPTLLFLVVFYGTQFVTWDRTPRVARTVLMALDVAALYIWFYVFPWPGFVVLFLGFAGLLVYGLIARHRKWKRGLMQADWTVIVIAVLALVFITPAMWLPAERIELSDGPNIVGYVLASDSDWTTIMIEEDRRIEIVESSDIESRQICNLEIDSAGRSVSQLIMSESGEARNPQCSPVA